MEEKEEVEVEQEEGEGEGEWVYDEYEDEDEDGDRRRRSVRDEEKGTSGRQATRKKEVKHVRLDYDYDDDYVDIAHYDDDNDYGDFVAYGDDNDYEDLVDYRDDNDYEYDDYYNDGVFVGSITNASVEDGNNVKVEEWIVGEKGGWIKNDEVVLNGREIFGPEGERLVESETKWEYFPKEKDTGNKVQLLNDDKKDDDMVDSRSIVKDEGDVKGGKTTLEGNETKLLDGEHFNSELLLTQKRGDELLSLVPLEKTLSPAVSGNKIEGHRNQNKTTEAPKRMMLTPVKNTEEITK